MSKSPCRIYNEIEYLAEVALTANKFTIQATKTGQLFITILRQVGFKCWKKGISLTICENLSGEVILQEIQEVIRCLKQ
jgi:hypothetical protein